MTNIRDWTSRLITGAMLIGAAILVIAAAKRRLTPPTTDPPVDVVSNWRSFASSGNEVGDSDGSVTLVEFGDFQCPFCRVLAFRLDSLRVRHPREIRILFRNYPLRGIHPYAFKAAVAAECAALQGQFAAYYRALFRRQAHIGEVPWAELAQQVGVPDRAAFASCVAEDRTASIIDADTAAGNRLGVYATLAVLVGDKYIAGAPSLEQLEQLVNAHPRPGR